MMELSNLAHGVFVGFQFGGNLGVDRPYTLIQFKPELSYASTHVQYTQTESNRLKAKTIRVSSRINDFRLTGSPFSGTRLTGSQVANKCAGRWKLLNESIRIPKSRFDSTEIRS